MSEIDPKMIGVCYREGPITDADYEEAIQALQNALDLDDSKGCPVCHDAHSAAQCHHNPLVLARQWAAATSVYACYHCGFVAANDEEALAHFGLPGQEKPACQNTPDADLIERLRAIARQRQLQPLEAFRIPLETHSEWIAADRIASLKAENERLRLSLDAYDKLSLVISSAVNFSDPEFSDRLTEVILAGRAALSPTEKLVQPASVPAERRCDHPVSEQDEKWEDCGFGVCEECGAGLIDDFPCLRCKGEERRSLGLSVALAPASGDRTEPAPRKPVVEPNNSTSEAGE